eukprot:Plantae.Rhodophyta-Palmaria_palmata.ctg2585.p1 GENE.Plantae.Rhodophyta-Palmaria_palmata.ctg2585~~Plantae.Rhodophyta-Palmaria_palmata.ctg2585.p1  ORF type:complete len:421 (-),score=92.38 Plantae.Rhodophyta-Palmaria_palmata.ctg2585:343-1605(-)
MKSVFLTLFFAAFCSKAISSCLEDGSALPVRPQITDSVVLSFTVPTADFVKDGITLPSTGVPVALRGMFVSCDSESGKHSATSTYLPSPGSAVVSKKYDGGYSFWVAFEEPDLLVEFEVSNDGSAEGRATHNFYRPHGAVLEESALTQSEGVQALKSAIEGNADGPKLVKVIDHAKAAKGVDLDLAPSTVVVFGNPKLGSPLWLQQPAAGIELPIEILVAESPLGVVYVSYNAPGGLLERFGLDKVKSVLEKIDGALANLASAATGKTLKPAGLSFDASDDGESKFLAGIESSFATGPDPGKSFETLLAALEAAPPVNIAYQIPHDLSANKVGIDTGGNINRVAVFGNPALGTTVMQSSFTAALDLPLKIAVWNSGEKLAKTTVGFTQPEWIAERHGVASLNPKLGGAARNFAAVALMQN